jgi:hypothetical protein
MMMIEVNDTIREKEIYSFEEMRKTYIPFIWIEIID